MINEKFTIIDEQNDFIVVNKSSGIGFHDEDDQLGLFNTIKNNFSQEKRCGEQTLYPVHRLDKMTSGLLIIAKNKSAAQTFQQLFEQRKIQKYYLAISDKKPKKKQGLIKGDMEKSRRGAWKLLRSQQNPAISHFHSLALSPGKRLYIIKPLTGKTHQIRVALSSLGAPIIGDPTYHVQSKSDRGYLHAFALSFVYHEKLFKYVNPPNSGAEFLHDNMVKALLEITPPWSLNWPKTT